VERLPGLGRQADWRLVEVGLIWRGVVKALVRSAAIVEVEISAERSTGLADGFVGSQVHLLVFDAARPIQHDSEIDEPRAMGMYVMYIAQTWFGRVISIPRSRYG